MSVLVVSVFRRMVFFVTPSNVQTMANGFFSSFNVCDCFFIIDLEINERYWATS